MTKITSSEFQSDIQRYETEALNEPVTITKDGEDCLVLLSIEEYARLMRRDRRVFAVEDLTDEQTEAIRQAKVPDEYAHLDDELKDWNP